MRHSTYHKPPTSHLRSRRLLPWLLAFATLITTIPLATPRAHAADPIALGARIEDGGLDAPSDAAAIDNYAALTSRMPAIVMWYQEWGEYYNYFSSRCADNIWSRSAVPMITWEPWDGQVADPAYKLSNIVRGDYDAYIRQYATDAKAWGHPFFLRFAHEMNGNWYPWGVGPRNPNGNTPADYIAAWRHVHDIFTQVGATNVRWVWSPNALSSNSPDAAATYPGDAYVDWIAMDGYNEGTDPGAGDGGWTSLAALFGPTYDALTALTGKPLMIAETSSAEAGGSKAAWITQGLLTDVPTRLPRVRAVIWFDKNKEADWRVNSSPAALAAYRSVVASPRYQGQPDMSSTNAATPATNTPATPTSPTNTPTATSTPVPPTATSTATNTPVPPTNTLIATSTPTKTSVPPTATNTPTRPTATNTPTNTSIPPTATNTSVPPTVTTAPAALPSPWAHRDIGNVGLAGSAGYTNGAFTVGGSGGDIWGGTDAFHYAYHPLNGDGQIVAHVASQRNTDPWAKAGVMIRESLNPSSRYADMVLTPGNGAAFQRRTSPGANAVHTGRGGITVPSWVKLVRGGTMLTGYVSSDGATWTRVGTDTIPMITTVYAGLAVTAHNNAALNTATFDHVAVSTSPSANQAGYWRLDEGTGATAADASGNGATGVLQGGASWAAGKVGPSALSLNGWSGYVDVPRAVVDTSKSYSVAA